MGVFGDLTVILKVKISDLQVADALRKAVKGLAKGTLTLEDCDLTEEGIQLSYHRTPRYEEYKNSNKR